MSTEAATNHGSDKVHLIGIHRGVAVHVLDQLLQVQVLDGVARFAIQTRLDHLSCPQMQSRCATFRNSCPSSPKAPDFVVQLLHGVLHKLFVQSLVPSQIAHRLPEFGHETLHLTISEHAVVKQFPHVHVQDQAGHFGQEARLAAKLKTLAAGHITIFRGEDLTQDVLHGQAIQDFTMGLPDLPTYLSQ